MMKPPVDILGSGPFTLAVANHGEIRTFTRRGVADLLDLIADGEDFLRGAAVADKVVGRAAASIMVIGGVARLHTRVMSRQALGILDGSGMEVEYDRLTDHIINRRGDGWCPLENICRNLDTPEECLMEIRKFFENNAN